MRRKRESEVQQQMCEREEWGVIFRGGWSPWELCFHLSWLRRLLPSPALSAVKTQKGLTAASKGLCFGAWLPRQRSFLSSTVPETFVPSSQILVSLWIEAFKNRFLYPLVRCIYVPKVLYLPSAQIITCPWVSRHSSHPCGPNLGKLKRTLPDPSSPCSQESHSPSFQLRGFTCPWTWMNGARGGPSVCLLLALITLPLRVTPVNACGGSPCLSQIRGVFQSVAAPLTHL